MTSIIKLHVLSGAEGESPTCYLLQVDECQLLLDCGWAESFDMNFISVLKKHISNIDAVLLSFPDANHLGALPFLVGKCGLSCPIYATVPVYKMGQMFMYDLFQSRENTEEFSLFSLDDVDSAFDRIMQLKYSQTVSLKGRGSGIQVTPLPAGHMIGGTIWKIAKEGEEEIIYAVDYNHKKERHLNGCVLKNLSRPNLLITDAFNVDYTQSRRQVRDEQLMSTIIQTMRNDGNLLIAVDTAGRVLELSQMLDQLWRAQGSGLLAYSIALLNNVSYNVLEFAKSQLEWMCDKIIKSVEDQRNNPFHFKHIHVCHSLVELACVPDPKVVLASVPDMQCGFSRDLFIEWCENEKNTIILTTRTAPGTLSRFLIDNPEQKTLTLDVRQRVKLKGKELEAFMNKKSQKEEELRKAEERKAQLATVNEDDQSDESDSEMQYEPGSARSRHDLMPKSEGKIKTNFFKQAKKGHPMFPFYEEKLKWDDYGEVIRPGDYAIIENTVVEVKEEILKEKKEEVLQSVAKIAKIADIPSKCLSTRRMLNIRATVKFIDFEGRSDGESIRRLVTQIKPRQMIIVRGTINSCNSLMKYCKKMESVSGQIFIPKLGEMIDATTEKRIYQVRLQDSIVSALKFYKAGDMELAWVDATLDMSMKKTDTRARQAMDVDGSEESEYDTIPTLKSLPVAQVSGHETVFVNEPKLLDLKQIFISRGIQAEFHAGVLICNKSLAIRRTKAGFMQIEGNLSNAYYQVRDILYEQYAIL